MEVSLFGAFIGGILSFISPCVLPLVPPYLCYIAGVTYEDIAKPSLGIHKKVILSSFAFVFGFSIIFIGLGAIATSFGIFITDNAEMFSIFAGLLIIFFGLHFLGVFRLSIMFREFRFQNQIKSGYVGAFLMGLAFAFGWTPCVGPILAAILFIAGSEQSLSQGVMLLSAYAAGIGLPFILAAAFTSRFLILSDRMKRNMPVVEKISGGFLVLAGLLFIFGGINEIGYWLQEFMPKINS